jgi:surfactin synthase thioesterase subunit
MDHSPPALRESVPHHAGGSHRLHRNCPAELPDTRNVRQPDAPGHSHQPDLPLITDISAEDPGPLLRRITRDATTARAAADATRSG